MEEYKMEFNNELEQKESITPTEYFKMVKERRNKVTDESLRVVYDNCLTLLNKSATTGQIDATKKLIFQLETIEKEIEIVKLGIDIFIYKDDVEEYIENISDKAVKIVELSQYEREIPDEIVDIIAKVKGKFDKLYVVFTDYTGEMERKVEKERRDKDPILFGAFEDKESDVLVDRFYYLGDWEDEYCDLTLEKMVAEMQAAKSVSPVRNINTPEDIAELKKQIRQLENSKKTSPMFTVMPSPPVKENIFRRIRTFLSGKN
jgi:hypothetical protein